VWGGKANAANARAQIYDRAANPLAAAAFLKPAGATNTDLVTALAPLIMQEVPPDQVSAAASNAPLSAPGLAHDMPASGAVIGISSSSAPTLFYAADNAQLNGRAHLRFAYQWCYSSGRLARGARASTLRSTSASAGLSTLRSAATEDGLPRTGATEDGLPAQGVRITCDSQGQPAVWEVLADTSGLRLIFVSQSVEAGAAAEFGKPLAGRRYAVERSLEEAPTAVVPRVIDDGPVPMGPMVYLSAGTRDVSTVLCRCMPAQVKRLVVTRTFELTRLDSAAMATFLSNAGSGSNAPPVLWPAEERDASRLAHCLRLPKAF
jgi:hypothetical protein